MAVTVAMAPLACAAPVEDAESSEDEVRVAVDTSLAEVDATAYAITLRVGGAPGQETFTASVKGTYVATADLDTLSLDFEGNTIDDVKVSGRVAQHRRQGKKLLVALPSPVRKGKSFSTQIAYHGAIAQADQANPNDFLAFGGLQVKQQNTDGKRIFASLSWPYKARRWLPLRDHPSDGATVSFDLTFPKTFTVVANGKKTNEAVNTDGTKSWRYEATTPMPAYDFHVAAYEGWKTDEHQAASGMPIRTFTYANDHARAPASYRAIDDAFDFYEKTYGAYRWESAAFLEVPIFGGGMEHATVVSMDETLFSDPKGAREVAFHELAHHWSGNLVRIRRWNDFWLSEGITDYLTGKSIAAIDGAAAGLAHWRSYQREAFAADASSPHPIAPRGSEVDVLSIFDAISYKKGALFVRMLESVVGEEALTAFLKTWFAKHAFAAASSEEFESELEAATNEDLSAFFADFLYAPNHPEVDVTFTTTGAETRVVVQQVQTKGPAGGYRFPLELDFVDAQGAKERVRVDLTGKRTEATVSLARTPKSVVVDPGEFAIAASVCGRPEATCKASYRCVRAGAQSVCQAP